MMQLDDSSLLLTELQLITQRVCREEAQRLQASLYDQKGANLTEVLKDVLEVLQNREKELLAVLQVAQEFIEKASAKAREADLRKEELEKCYREEAELRDEVESLKVRTSQHSLYSANEGYCKLSLALMESERAQARLEQQLSDNRTAIPEEADEEDWVESPSKEATWALKVKTLTREVNTDEVERLKKKLRSNKQSFKEAESRRGHAEERAESLRGKVAGLQRQVVDLSRKVEDLTEDAETQTAKAHDSELKTSALIERLSGLEE
jgi:chromosome segregation ATPase